MALLLEAGRRSSPPFDPVRRLPSEAGRPEVSGKFLAASGEKLYVRGVTYGTFRPGADGSPYPPPDVVEQDFAAMSAYGFNAVRTYTVPPRWLLDCAAEHGLRVMVGLPWEQHVAFLDERRRARSIELRVRDGVRACAGHPAVLCYAVGNEIPAAIVRWHGRRRIERFLERLSRAAKEEDPEGLVTYVNFPSTEYLELSSLDIVTFNVYLEAERPLSAYLARLQTLAGERPLLMTELGLDGRSHGENEQARALRWQIKTAASAGCAGAFVFSWTDEWHRGGHEVLDWGFGLTSRERTPKPALAAASEAFDELPPQPAAGWPRISVVVCSCNGQATLRDCFDGLTQLDYPNYEVIVVNDGSTDATSEIAREYPFQLVNTGNCGLSSARNTGLAAATGEIVAYIDDDARPDRDWLTYLAHTFRTTRHAGVGGPNIAPPGDSPIADCVANAPGGPVHVLLSDSEAEHIPGCNMAFRRECLEAVGGFDAQFRAAGDDVDVCWRVQEQGWTLGFSPAAMVWHHRRASVRAYWRQQRGYGKAEALLERKWPEKYNTAGHLPWQGRLYGKGLVHSPLPRRRRVYFGTWGSGAFQRLYEPADGALRSLTTTPEWYLLIVLLALLSGLGLVWPQLLVAVPFAVLAAAPPLLHALNGAADATLSPRSDRRGQRLALRALTAALYLLQPVARLWGRVMHGLTPWRLRGPRTPVAPGTRTLTAWTEQWEPPEARPRRVEAELLRLGAAVVRGGHFDSWDLEVRAGPLGRARLSTAVEEHGHGRQLALYRCAAHWPRAVKLLVVAAVALALAALTQGGPAAGALATAAAVVVVGAAWGAALALGALHDATCRAVGASPTGGAPRDGPAP